MQASDATRDWTRELAAGGSDAIAALREALLRGLRRSFGASVSDALLEEFAQEAAMRVLGSLESYRGDSRFLSWALAITMRVAYTELRRAQFRDVSLEEAAESGARIEPAAAGVTADQRVAQERLAALLRSAVDTELTPRQRRALHAELSGMPIAEIADRMGNSRGALYKLLHDARRKLKAALTAKGVGPGEIESAWPAGGVTWTP